MNKLVTYIRGLIARVLQSIAMDTAGIIRDLQRLEARIEKAIEKDLSKGEQMVRQKEALDQALNANNKNLDTAYKLLNQVSEIAK